MGKICRMSKLKVQLPGRTAFFLALSIILLSAFNAAARAAPAERLRFRVQVAQGLDQSPLSGRLLIFMTQQTKPLEVIEQDFLNPGSVWITGAEVSNLEPGKPFEVDADALSFPAAFSTAPAGDYQLMALLDRDHSYTYNGTGAGDLLSAVTLQRNLNPSQSGTLELTLTKKVPDKPLADTDSIKLITFESPALTSFWGRPVNMRAGVVLPPSYLKSARARYPTVYVVHGFGGSHRTAWRRGASLLKEMTEGKTPEMIYVFLDGSWPTGHHEFADSVNNGPWGRVLTTEFIPYLEKRFRMDANPAGRLLTGHSSGGWSTLWLQVTYPDFFGGTWSTSPDPVDFRNFTGPDLTNPSQNFYRKRDGTPYNLVRFRGKELWTLEEYARSERVLGGYGGQMASFEAVFSPRGQDGQPMPLFDRDTGRIDPFVARAWERYDIARILRNNWRTLAPRLKGKLHIIVGTADTFHLDEAVRLLSDTLKGLGSDATFEFVEGRDHFDLYEGGLAERIASEMYATARPQKKSR
jgi:S-formylglutathione hydrolase FrmB